MNQINGVFIAQGERSESHMFINVVGCFLLGCCLVRRHRHSLQFSFCPLPPSPLFLLIVQYLVPFPQILFYTFIVCCVPPFLLSQQAQPVCF
jgi:hypothetical protein